MNQDNPAVSQLLEIPPAVIEAAATDPTFVPSMGRRYLLVAMRRLNEALRSSDVSIGQRLAAVETFAKVAGINRQQDVASGPAFELTINFSGKEPEARLSQKAAEPPIDVPSREITADAAPANA